MKGQFMWGRDVMPVPTTLPTARLSGKETKSKREGCGSGMIMNAGAIARSGASGNMSATMNRTATRQFPMAGLAGLNGSRQLMEEANERKRTRRLLNSWNPCEGYLRPSQQYTKNLLIRHAAKSARRNAGNIAARRIAAGAG